jgi:hypothetical protein
MKITIHVIAGLPGCVEPVVSVNGDVLTYSGIDYDLSDVPVGGVGEPEGDHPFIGPITRPLDEINAAVIWQFDPVTALSDQGSSHPVFDIENGPLPDPVRRSVSDVN